MPALIASTHKTIAIIKDSQDFIKDFNKNKVNENFLNSSKKASKLFERNKLGND